MVLFVCNVHTFMYVVLEAIRTSLRGRTHKFQNVPGGSGGGIPPPPSLGTLPLTIISLPLRKLHMAHQVHVHVHVIFCYYCSVLGKCPCTHVNVPHFKASMQQLPYKCMQFISQVSTHAGQNHELCLSTHVHLPGTLLYHPNSMVGGGGGKADIPGLLPF